MVDADDDDVVRCKDGPSGSKRLGYLPEIRDRSFHLFSESHALTHTL
jgi:hypothetical protein